MEWKLLYDIMYRIAHNHMRSFVISEMKKLIFIIFHIKNTSLLGKSQDCEYTLIERINKWSTKSMTKISKCRYVSDFVIF